MSELFSLIHLPAIGFAIGIIIGLTGVGGGSLMTPILVGGLGIPPAIAVGTDLLFASITKSFGAVAHWRIGNVAKRLLVVLIASSLTGAACVLCRESAGVGGIRRQPLGNHGER